MTTNTNTVTRQQIIEAIHAANRHPLQSSEFLAGEAWERYRLRDLAYTIAAKVAGSGIKFTTDFYFESPGITLWVNFNADGAAMLNAWHGAQQDPGMESVARVEIPNWVA